FVEQMKKGVSELLSQTLGLATDPLKDKVVDTLTERLGEQFKGAAKKLLGKTLDKKLDELTKPHIEKATVKILAALQTDTRKPDSASYASSAATETRFEAREAMAKKSISETQELSRLAEEVQTLVYQDKVNLAEEKLVECKTKWDNVNAKVKFA